MVFAVLISSYEDLLKNALIGKVFSVHACNIFSLYGEVDFSLETLRIFLEGKQRNMANTMNGLPWKNIAIDIDGIRSAKRRKQILELVSQKKAAGLDVRVYK